MLKQFYSKCKQLQYTKMQIIEFMNYFKIDVIVICDYILMIFGIIIIKWKK